MTAICRALEKQLKDERKAQVEYLNLEQKIYASEIPVSMLKLRMAKTFGAISKDETRHELELEGIKRKICRR